MRRQLKLQDHKLGEIVYSTADTRTEAARRDLEAFDRELASSEIELSRYLPSPGGVDYEEDFEVVLEEPSVRPRSRATPSRRRPPRRRPPHRRW